MYYIEVVKHIRAYPVYFLTPMHKATPSARERCCARMGVAGATRPRPCRRSADGAKILSRHEACHEVCHEASHEVLRNLCFFSEVWLMNRELSGHDV